MAVTTTSRNQFAIVTVNTESTTWGAYLNTYNFERLDKACGGNLSITLTTSSYTLNDTVPTDETHYDNYDLTQTYSLGHTTVVIPNRDGVWNFTIIPYGGSSSYGVRFQVNGTSNYTQYFTNPCAVKLHTNSGTINVVSHTPYGGTKEPLGPFYTGSVTTSAQTMYLTFSPPFKELKPGMLFTFAPGTVASQTSMSIVVDSISGKSLFESTGDPISTTAPSWTSTTGLITCQYNGTAFNKIAPAQIPAVVPEPPTLTYFESPEYIPTAESTGSWTHTLSLPQETIVQAFFRCIDDELGYVVGDIVPYPGWIVENGQHFGVTWKVDATTLVFRVGYHGMLVPHATTGIATVINVSKWKLFFRAWDME